MPQGSCIGPVAFLTYIFALYDIVSYYLPNVGGFADDTQIYYSFQADSDTSREEAICELECCIAAVRESMLSLNLKLNDSKTELLVIGSRQQLTKIDLGNFRFKIGNTTSLLCRVPEI